MMRHVGDLNSPTFVTSFDSKVDFQPNAIDLRLESVKRIETQGVFSLDEESKNHLRTFDVIENENDEFFLDQGVYQITYWNTIRVPHGQAGIVIPRSTLVRNGLILTSGLYDSGYEGSMVSCLHVTCNLFRVKKHTRLAQYICFDAETLKLYQGSYS